MSLRTLMQAGPVKVNELSAKLAETSDGAVKTREKLFAELKNELELHTSLEEQHLFPLLRRHAETKALVLDAIKDNKDLRTKLAEFDAVPKTDESFHARLKDLQKAFRQHARDEKRELLPAVQRALNEEQIERVTEKFEAGVAEAERLRHEEAEARRAKAREQAVEREHNTGEESAEHHRQAQERAEAEHRTEQETAAKRTKQEADRHTTQEAEAKRVKQETGRRAEPEVAAAVNRAALSDVTAPRTKDKLDRSARDLTETGQTTTSTQAEIVRFVDIAPAGRSRPATPRTAAQRETFASLPGIATTAAADLQSAWMNCLNEVTAAGTRLSQAVLRQAAEQQQWLVSQTMQGWITRNARATQVAVRMLQASIRPLADRTGANPLNGGSSQPER